MSLIPCALLRTLSGLLLLIRRKKGLSSKKTKKFFFEKFKTFLVQTNNKIIYKLLRLVKKE